MDSNFLNVRPNMLRNENYIHKALLFIANFGEMDEHVKKFDVR